MKHALMLQLRMYNIAANFAFFTLDYQNYLIWGKQHGLYAWVMLLFFFTLMHTFVILYSCVSSKKLKDVLYVSTNLGALRVSAFLFQAIYIFTNIRDEALIDPNINSKEFQASMLFHTLTTHYCIVIMVMLVLNFQYQKKKYNKPIMAFFIVTGAICLIVNGKLLFTGLEIKL